MTKYALFLISVIFPLILSCSDMGENVPVNNNPPDTLLSYVFDIQPIFIANCTNCHTNGGQNGNLRLDSYALLMNTGDHGPVIRPFLPDSSYLVLKIEGRAPGERMPAGGSLSSADSLKIRTWVAQGAFDN